MGDPFEFDSRYEDEPDYNEDKSGRFDSYDDGRDDEGVEAVGKYVHHTQKALLVDIDGQEMWIPFSQIYEHDGNLDYIQKHTKINLVLSGWIAEQKGLA